jgi:large subunit ribosomal protein L10
VWFLWTTVITEDDPIAPLQILAKFAKEFNVPQLKIGIVEGSYQDKNALNELAKFPSKNAMFAQVVGSISSPLYSLVGTLQASMQNLISVLRQASEKVEKQKATVG